MKKVFLLMMAIGLCLFYFGCTKSTCSPHTVQDDEPAILSYLNANHVTGYVKDASGLYYKIDSLGAGPMPTPSSTLYVRYKGMFTDNAIFDSAADASKTGFVLQTLIQGWQIGLPLIGKGGGIHLYVPSALAYGCTTVGPIPGNSILVFQIELVDVK